MTMRELAEAVSKVLAGQVPEYIVIVEHEKSIMLKLARGEPTVTQSWDEYSVNIYVSKDGKILVSSFRSSSPEEAVRKTTAIISRLQPSPLYAPLPEPTGKSYSLVDSAVNDMVETGDLGRIVEDLELDSIGNSAGAITLGRESRLLVSSTGASLEGARTYFHGYVRVFADDDTSGQWSWTSTGYEPSKAKKAIQVAKDLAAECKKLPKEKLEGGDYRVLLSPMVAGNLLETVVRAASAASIIFGMSFFRPDMIGQQVAGPALTIMDAPTHTGLPGYSLFDDEAVATRDKHVIRNGVLETLLHNSKTAKLMGQENTGNAGILMPRPFNIIVGEGDIGDSELLEALGDGLYATNNWYTRFQNYPEGLFSTVTRDALFVVRRGKPVACAKRARITGSMKDLIRNVEAAGSTRWPIQWWEVTTPSLLPHVLVSRIGITSE